MKWFSVSMIEFASNHRLLIRFRSVVILRFHKAVEGWGSLVPRLDGVISGPRRVAAYQIINHLLLARGRRLQDAPNLTHRGVLKSLYPFELIVLIVLYNACRLCEMMLSMSRGYDLSYVDSEQPTGLRVSSEMNCNIKMKLSLYFNMGFFRFVHNRVLLVIAEVYCWITVAGITLDLLLLSVTLS